MRGPAAYQSADEWLLHFQLLRFPLPPVLAAAARSCHVLLLLRLDSRLLLLNGWLLLLLFLLLFRLSGGHRRYQTRTNIVHHKPFQKKKVYKHLNTCIISRASCGLTVNRL